MRPRTASRHLAAALVALAAAGLSGRAPAQYLDPATIPTPDRVVLNSILEFERSDVERSLPSAAVVVILRTETSPEICRQFMLRRPDGEPEQAVACREGRQEWVLRTAASLLPLPAATLASRVEMAAETAGRTGSPSARSDVLAGLRTGAGRPGVAPGPTGPAVSAPGDTPQEAMAIPLETPPLPACPDRVCDAATTQEAVPEAMIASIPLPPPRPELGIGGTEVTLAELEIPVRPPTAAETPPAAAAEPSIDDAEPEVADLAEPETAPVVPGPEEILAEAEIEDETVVEGVAIPAEPEPAVAAPAPADLPAAVVVHTTPVEAAIAAANTGDVAVDLALQVTVGRGLAIGTSPSAAPASNAAAADAPPPRNGGGAVLPAAVLGLSLPLAEDPAAASVSAALGSGPEAPPEEEPAEEVGAVAVLVTQTGLLALPVHKPAAGHATPASLTASELTALVPRRPPPPAVRAPAAAPPAPEAPPPQPLSLPIPLNAPN